MPRIYDSTNEPHDFCNGCFPRSEGTARAAFGNRGNGPDDRGNRFEYNADHPPYVETNYVCEECGDPLVWDDDN